MAIGDWGPCPSGGEHQWGQKEGAPQGTLVCRKCGGS